MSIKYFGDENPIGTSIQMIYGKDQSKVFKIVGVAAEFPKARTIGFDFLDKLRKTSAQLTRITIIMIGMLS
ncbi:MAG: hypothetical protein U5K54_26230 [Cytophagales bacterium]|nr:hypothetical protein [Cytophagales bacterium]